MQEHQSPHSLTMADADRLAAEPSASNRRIIAEKLVARYDSGWAESERVIADQLLRALTRDVEVAVRMALSRSVAMSTAIPRDVAILLAHDIADVAQPILSDSDLLDAEDLIDIIARHGPEHQLFIAGRRSLDARVSAALVAEDDPGVIARLVANTGAEIAEPDLQRVVERHGDDARINTPLSERAQLPLAVAERLVARVSQRLRERLTREGRISALLALDETDEATLLLVDPTSDALDVLALVERLHRSDQLSASLIGRALERGDRIMATAIVARMSGASMPSVHGRLFHTDETSVLALLARAGIGRAKGLELARLVRDL